MRCIDKCDFTVYSEGEFFCSYYKEYLESEGTIESGKDNINVVPKIVVYRCEECIEDKLNIGDSSFEEKLRRLKRCVGWLADSFYSHKDTFEENLTSLYRIIESIENREDGNGEGEV